MRGLFGEFASTVVFESSEAECKAVLEEDIVCRVKAGTTEVPELELAGSEADTSEDDENDGMEADVGVSGSSS